LKPLSLKEVNKDKIKMKTKRENEKDKERKDKSGNNTSPHTAKTIMFTRTEMQIALPKCSLSFSLPNKSKYLTSWTKKFLDAIQTPPKGSHLLRGLSSKSHFIPKHSFQKLLVYRT